MLEVGVEGEGRHQGTELVQGHLGVGQFGVAVANRVPVVGGNRALEPNDASGVGLTIGNAGNGEHAHHVGLELRDEGGVLLFAVVGLVGQTQTGLAHEGDVGARVAVVGVDVVVEETTVASGLEGTQHFRELLGRGRRLGEGQIVDYRGNAFGLNSGLIHEGGVEVADLLGDRTRLPGLGGHVLNDGLHAVFAEFAKPVEGAVTGAVTRDLLVVEPRTVRELEEVVLRTNGGLDRGGVNAA